MKKLLILIGSLIFIVPFTSRAGVVENYLHGLYYEGLGEYKSAYREYQKALKVENLPNIQIKLALIDYYLGNASVAHDRLKKAIIEFPDSPSVATIFGELTYEMSLHETDPDKRNELIKESKNAMLKAVELDPSDKNYYNLVLILIDAGDYDIAMDVLNIALESNPSPIYYEKRGFLYIIQGDTQKGREDLMIAADAGQIYSMVKLGEIELQAGNIDEALMYFEKAFYTNPEMPEPMLYIGDIHYQRQNYKEALGYYFEALKYAEQKQVVPILDWIGEIAVKINDYELAYEVYKELISLVPEDSRYYYMAASFADFLGKPDAEEIYLKALELFPDFSFLNKRLAIFYLNKGESQKALDAILPIDPIEKDLEYYMIKGSAYYDLGKFDLAEQTYLEGIKDNPTNTLLMLSLASVYFDAKRFDECLKILDKAIELEPDSATVQNFLGYAYADMNINLDKAEKLINSALKQDPENYAYIDSMAWLLYRKGNLKKAYEYIQKAIAIEPDDKEILKHFEEIKSKMK